MSNSKCKLSKFLVICVAFVSMLTNVYSAYQESVKVLAVENRYALVQLGFDISDALQTEYVVFDSTASDFDSNIVYIWNNGINDWVKTTMPAFLNGNLFYNKTIKDVMVITDSLNAIQKFGELAVWAPEMFVIDQLNYPTILNTVNEEYKFTVPQWKIFSEKYNVTVENVATNSSRYKQPLWDFSLPHFTVEARKNSANANLQSKATQNSSVEVVIVDTEYLNESYESTDAEDITVVEEAPVPAVVEPAAEETSVPAVVEPAAAIEKQSEDDDNIVVIDAKKGMVESAVVAPAESSAETFAAPVESTKATVEEAKEEVSEMPEASVAPVDDSINEKADVISTNTVNSIEEDKMTVVSNAVTVVEEQNEDLDAGAESAEVDIAEEKDQPIVTNIAVEVEEDLSAPVPPAPEIDTNLEL